MAYRRRYSPRVATPRPGKAVETVIEWSDIKNRFLETVADGKQWPSGPNANHSGVLTLEGFAKDNGKGHRSSFFADTPREAIDYVRNGYRAKEFAHAINAVPFTENPRVTWSSEEGDPDAGRLIGGYDEFFLDRAEREARGGIRVILDYCFASMVTPEVIKAYGTWIAGFLGSLEASGFDLTVDIRSKLHDLWGTRGSKRRHDYFVRVKRENELSDFTEWSALFSPGGYRYLLVYTASPMVADKNGHPMNTGHGTTLPDTEWKLSYDREAGIVEVSNDQRSAISAESVIETLNTHATEAGLI